MRLVLVLVAAALALAPAAAASESHPTLAELETEVMCPTCHTLLEVSDSPVAERMRVFIRGRIAAGDRKSEIKAKLVAQFGEAVLAAPRKRGFGLVAWLAPVGILGGGCLALAWVVARTTRRRSTTDGDAELDADTEAAIAAALADGER